MRIHPLVYLVFLVSSCNPHLLADPPPTQISTSRAQPLSVSTADLQRETIISLAIRDLSNRLSLELKSIRVISSEAVLWPDTSLGCPHPGEVYKQQTVHGYWVWLEANGQAYGYHTDTMDTVILCPEEDLPSIPVTPGEIDDGEPWMPVD